MDRPLSSRLSSGLAANIKGRNFEDEVADLYRLQGAHVQQNIEVCNKKVDVLATFTHPVRHRVIVECKDEKRAVDATRRVREFYGLLTAARKTNEADSAEIITRAPWGDAAKGFANETGVSLFTYIEKIRTLIDFTHYLKALIDRFEYYNPAMPGEPALGKYYIDLSAEREVEGRLEKLPVIDTYVHEWLDDTENDSTNLAIFGEYGAGKSSFCSKLAADLAAAFLYSPSAARIPILLNLRDFVGKLDIEAYVTSFLDRECSVPNPKIKTFTRMAEAGIFLLIFDGFDEMAVQVDADKLESNLLQIEKFAAIPGCKTILTSRPEYFTNVREEIEAIDPAENPLLSRRSRYEPLRILPWDDGQIEQFLKRRVPLVKGAQRSWTFYRDKIKSIGRLTDLSQRPVLLDMIVKTLPTLVKKNATVNLPNLYRAYLSNEIKRQKVLKRRDLLISENDRFQLLQEIAARTYADTRETITFVSVRQLIETELNPPKHEVEAHTREFLTNSFLVRRGDTYAFSHESIREYLVAAQFVEEIKNGEPRFLRRRTLQPVILDFMVEMGPHEPRLLYWIERTQEIPLGESSILAGNAVSLLCSMSRRSLTRKDLSKTKLSFASFSLADLQGTELKDAWLHSCNFVGTRMRRADLEKARSIKDSVFLLFYIDKAGKRDMDWSDKELLLSLQKKHEVRSNSLGTQIFEMGDALDDEFAATMLVLEAGDLRTLDVLRDYCSTMITGDVAIYWDEIETLFSKHPKAKGVFNRLVEDAASRTRELMSPKDRPDDGLN